MRAIHLSDLNLATRTLLAVPARARAATMQDLVGAAQVADKFRKQTGRAHSVYGNGTLGAACQHRKKAKMPDRCDETYLECMGIVIGHIIGKGVDEEP